MFIDRSVYWRDWGRSCEGLFLLSLEETLRPQQVAGLLQEQLSQRYGGLPWRAASFKSELEQLVGKILAWCRWLMLIFVVVAALALSQALPNPALRELMATLYLLGGQRRLLHQLTRSTVLVTTLLVASLAFTFGTSLSYLLVYTLKQSGSYWLWKVSGTSYGPSLAIILLLALFFVVVTMKQSAWLPRRN